MACNLHLLFPTPILVVETTSFFEDHHKIIQEDYESNTDNINVSKDKFLLNKFPQLKNWILDQVHQYAVNTMACDSKFNITQSWSILSNKNLHFHQHPNSIISGAYYIDADNNSSEIKFLKPYIHGQIKWKTDINLYKEQDWLWDGVSFKPKTGTLILFPSYLNHGVTTNNLESNRCVLSFNTWFKDSIGSIEELNFLQINS